MPIGQWGVTDKEWSHAGHSLCINAWYPRSEMAITLVWYQGFVDGVLRVEGHNRGEVRHKLEAKAEESFTESGEFGQEEF